MMEEDWVIKMRRKSTKPAPYHGAFTGDHTNNKNHNCMIVKRAGKY